MRKKISRCICLIALSLAGTGATAATAGVTLESAIRADGLIDWSVLGPPSTNLVSPFTLDVPGVSGLAVTVSQRMGSFRRLVQRGDQALPGSWGGNFAPGEALLWTTGLDNGPITLDFDAPVQGVGVQIQPLNFGSFTASVEAFDSANALLASFTFSGLSNSNADDSALFLGILSTANDIDRVVFGVPVEPLGEEVQNFVINGPRIQVAAIPEPQTYALLLAGLGLMGFAFARRTS